MPKRKEFISPVPVGTEEFYRFSTSVLEQTSSLVNNALEWELRPFGLTVPQFRVLSLLDSAPEEGSTLDNMALFMGRRLNTMSTMINNMEKRGLVRREKAGRKQKSTIYITEKGRDLFENQITTHSIEMIFSSLTTEEQRDFLGLLFVIRYRAEKLLGVNYKPPFLQREPQRPEDFDNSG